MLSFNERLFDVLVLNASEKASRWYERRIRKWIFTDDMVLFIKIKVDIVSKLLVYPSIPESVPILSSMPHKLAFLLSKQICIYIYFALN